MHLLDDSLHVPNGVGEDSVAAVGTVGDQRREPVAVAFEVINRTAHLVSHVLGERGPWRDESRVRRIEKSDVRSQRRTRAQTWREAGHFTSEAAVGPASHKDPLATRVEPRHTHRAVVGLRPAARKAQP